MNYIYQRHNPIVAYADTKKSLLLINMDHEFHFQEISNMIKTMCRQAHKSTLLSAHSVLNLPLLREKIQRNHLLMLTETDLQNSLFHTERWRTKVRLKHTTFSTCFKI